MPRRRRLFCRVCNLPDADGQTLSSRGLCPDCAEARVRAELERAATPGTLENERRVRGGRRRWELARERTVVPDP